MYLREKDIFKNSHQWLNKNYPTSKYDASGSQHAIDSITKKNLGRIPLSDHRWKTGEIVGFRSGIQVQNSTGKIWINNGVKEHQIFVQELSKFDSSFKRGLLPMKKEQRKQISETRIERNITSSNKGKVKCYNGKIFAYFFKNDIPDGWVHTTMLTGVKISNNDKHWYNDGIDNYLLHHESAENKGLLKGRLHRTKNQPKDCQL